MKQQKTLLILVLILVVMGGAYYGINQYNNAKEEAEYWAALEEEAASVIYVSDIDSETIEKITYCNEGIETPYTFVLEDEVWIYEANPDIAIQQYYISSILVNYNEIIAIREIVGGEDLDAYGLEETQNYLILEDVDGKEYAFYFGKLIDEAYYLSTDNKENIYTVESKLMTAISYDLITLVEDDIFPTIASTQMESVTISDSEEERIYTEEDEGVFETIATGLSSLSLLTCIDAYGTDHLADYGLEESNRTVVAFVYNEISKASLYVGAYNETEDVYYIQVAGSDIVYTISGDAGAMLLYVTETDEEES